MTRLRWGVLGTGNIARQFATGVRGCRRGVLAAVGSRSVESARDFAGKFDVPAAAGSYDELVRRDDVDAIYVSLPNNLHHEWTIRSLEAGKHVLCEKPLAVSADEAREMFDASRRARRLLIEAYMYRAHPQTAAVMQQVRSGAIGELRHVRTNFSFKVARTAGNIRFDPALAGGALMDVGGYCLSFSMLVAGAPPSVVHAIGRRHPAGVDEQTSVLMQFPAGLTASFTVGMAMQADNTAMISGSDGYLEIAWPWKPVAGRSGYVIARQIPPRQDAAGRPVPASAPREAVEVPVDQDLYGIEADAFAACVFDGVAPFVSEAESVEYARLLQSIRRQVGLDY
jgi:predicted dehydrogenase